MEITLKTNDQTALDEIVAQARKLGIEIILPLPTNNKTEAERKEIMKRIYAYNNPNFDAEGWDEYLKDVREDRIQPNRDV